jgi:hypothetical protein
MNAEVRIFSILSTRKAFTSAAVAEKMGLLSKIGRKEVQEILDRLVASGTALRTGTDGYRLAPKPGAVRQQSLRESYALQNMVRGEYYATVEEHQLLAAHLKTLREKNNVRPTE